MNVTTEILQAQTKSAITEKGQLNDYGYDVSCNLGSIDIHEAVKVKDFAELTDTAVQLLNQVTKLSYITNVPSVAKGNDNLHAIGLGVMNLHGHLATQGIYYGSDDSIQFIDLFMESLRYHAMKASMNIAKNTGQVFTGFSGSDYGTGKFFDKYVSGEDVFISPTVSKALGNVPVITTEMWQQLKLDVMKYGLANAYLLAVAPTGTISYIRNSTASMAPITEKVETRDYETSRTIYPMPFMTKENQHLYTEAYDINPYKMIDLYATAQKHVDQGISMTLYVTDQWTTEQLAKVYIYAWTQGIKSVYYVRQRLMTIEECVQCSI